MTLNRLLTVSALLTMSTAFAQTKIIIGVSVPAADHGWTAGVVYHANQAKAMVEKMYPGTQVIVKTAKDANEQANQIQDMFTVNKINTLVILPQESAPLTAPIAALKRQGVYTVVVDRGLTNPAAQDAYVAGDNRSFGKVAAQFMGKQLGGKGNVVVLRGIPTVVDNQRVESFEAAMKAQYPDVKILDKKFGNWNRDDAFKVMQDYLTRYPKVDAVWAADDDMAVGVLKAIQQAGRKDIRVVLGGGGMKEMIKKIIDGSDKLVTANVTYPPSMIADAIMLAAKNRTAGKAPPKSTIIPSVLVSKANAQKFYFPKSPF